MTRVSRLLPVVALVALALVSGPTPAAEENAKLRLASDVWPPFTDVAGQTRLAVSLVHEALKRSGVAAETTVLEWSAVMAGLQGGQFDGSAAIWHSAEREKFLLFSDPYLENRLVLVGAKGSDVTAASLADLAGKRVAVVEQYAYGEALDAAKGPALIGGSSDQENLQKLLRREVDYMLVDELLIRYLAEHQQEETARLLEIGRRPLVRRELHFALRRELPAAASLIEGFNREIVKMLADGTYNVILSLGWIRADVDHDGLPEFVPSASQVGPSPPVSAYSILSATSATVLPKLQRYWFDGRVYESWDDVPDRYKQPPKTAADKPPPALLRF